MLSVLRHPRNRQRPLVRAAAIFAAVLAVGLLHAAPATVVHSFHRATFTNSHASALGGSDTVAIDESNGLFTDTDGTTIDGGSGNDTLRGGSGGEVLIGGTGGDVVIGGRGNDLGLMGDGNDTFVWNPGDGSDIVEGQADVDTLQFNGANVNETIALSANGSRARLTRDVGSIFMDLNGVEDVNVVAVGGTDDLTVNDLTGSGVSNVNLDLSGTPGSGFGDSQADEVFVDGTNGVDNLAVVGSGNSAKVTGAPALVRVTGGDPALDKLNVEGEAGNDAFTADPSVGGVIGVHFDGGADIDTVTTNGTPGADTFFVGPNGSSVFVANGANEFYDIVAENLHVNGLGGNDAITGGNGIAILTNLTIDGGGGSDTLQGGDGNDIIIGGSGNDVVLGARGNDVAFMGDGNDTFVWNPGDGNDTVEGQVGTDVLQFDGANINEQISLSANGARLRFTRDVANIVMDVNGVETTNFVALGGADTVTVNDLAGTSVTNVNVDLAFPPGSGTSDGQADNVIVNATNGADNIAVGGDATAAEVTGLAVPVRVTGGDPTMDKVSVEGLAGNDVFTADPAAGGQIIPVLDGGADVDTVTTNGTAGADTFSMGSTGANVFVANSAGALYECVSENLHVNGLGGDDTIRGGNGMATLTNLTIDGGSGNDTLQGGDGNDTIIGGSGNDVVFGARGNDVAFMGAGNDTFVWNPGDASDTVEGQDGADVLQFDGANINEQISLSANGSRLRFTRDVANVVMDVNGVETANFTALGGADRVTVDDLSGTGVTHVNVDLSGTPGSGTGDGQLDDVIVTGTNGVDTIGVSGSGGSAKVTGLSTVVGIAGAEFANDRLDINTLAGADTVHSHLAPNDIQLFVDGVPS
jgi:Ca2+-binding RTX toxin-like protein